MLDQCAANTGIHPAQALVDAGYCCDANLDAAARRHAEHGTETLIATGRLGHHEQVPPAPRGRIPTNATRKQRMARKLRTKPGSAAYRRRKAIVEPVFGQTITCQNARTLLLRGSWPRIRRVGCWRTRNAAGLAGSAIVVGLRRPRTTPAIPMAFISRSTVHRATTMPSRRSCRTPTSHRSAAPHRTGRGTLSMNAILVVNSAPRR